MYAAGIIRMMHAAFKYNVQRLKCQHKVEAVKRRQLNDVMNFIVGLFSCCN